MGTSKYYPILMNLFVEFYFYEPNNLRGWERIEKKLLIHNAKRHPSMYVCTMHVCMYVCMCVCTYTYVGMYILCMFVLCILFLGSIRKKITHSNPLEMN